VTVAALGPIWLPEHEIDEVTAAVPQASRTLVQHSRATHAVVFAGEGAQGLVVTVATMAWGSSPRRTLRSRGEVRLPGEHEGADRGSGRADDRALRARVRGPRWSS
jgi:hypothetical protein